MKFFSTLKTAMFPQVDPAVQQDIDDESVKNIRSVSLVVSCVEACLLLTYLPEIGHFSSETWVSLISVLFCVVSCLCGYLISRALITRQVRNHYLCILFKVVYFLLMSAWGVIVSYRHYVIEEQMLTFFTVQLMFVCFIVFRPWLSVFLMAASYSALYVAAYTYDGAQRIHPVNYFAFLFVSIVGMIVRFHAQRVSSEKKVELEKTNEELHYTGLHDALTALRNRQALDEDAAQLSGAELSACMLDITDFKKINDVYGHYVGDQILKETGRVLTRIFRDCRCYRYGGDEFLILGEGDLPYQEETCTFPCALSARRTLNVTLCLGYAKGTPVDNDTLFELIKTADREMYRIKAQTGSTR